MIERTNTIAIAERGPPLSEAEASEDGYVPMMIVRMWGNVIEPQSKPDYG
ncbi:MAG: hypothetical protein JEY71_11640 [Sphaerochaeta sp.]|nr:hypothetical protein [Sphaerochaeta sp.]